jgi:hypothetical protein
MEQKNPFFDLLKKGLLSLVTNRKYSDSGQFAGRKLKQIGGAYWKKFEPVSNNYHTKFNLFRWHRALGRLHISRAPVALAGARAPSAFAWSLTSCLCSAWTALLAAGLVSGSPAASVLAKVIITG